MQKIAVFSDVHGNLPPFKAVLKDIAKRSVDQVFCLGDLVDFAPWPNEVIQLMQTLGIPCLIGNHDERIAFDHPILPLAKHGAEERAARLSALTHTKQTITTESRRYLADLPGEFNIELNSAETIIKVLMVHGSLRSNDEYIYEDHPKDDLNAMLDQENADVLIMGHTHLPYIRQISDSRLALTCGSVGRSREEVPFATYLLLSVNNGQPYPEIVRIPFPVNETIEAIEKSDIPDFYADFFRMKAILVNSREAE